MQFLGVRSPNSTPVLPVFYFRYNKACSCNQYTCLKMDMPHMRQNGKISIGSQPHIYACRMKAPDCSNYPMAKASSVVAILKWHHSLGYVSVISRSLQCTGQYAHLFLSICIDQCTESIYKHINWAFILLDSIFCERKEHFLLFSKSPASARLWWHSEPLQWRAFMAFPIISLAAYLFLWCLAVLLTPQMQ